MCIYIEPARNCTSDEFQCDGDSCILKSWRCDKEHDCKDGTDEANCSEYTCTIVHLSHCFLWYQAIECFYSTPHTVRIHADSTSYHVLHACLEHKPLILRSICIW